MTSVGFEPDVKGVKVQFPNQLEDKAVLKLAPRFSLGFPYYQTEGPVLWRSNMLLIIKLGTTQTLAEQVRFELTDYF